MTNSERFFLVVVVVSKKKGGEREMELQSVERRSSFVRLKNVKLPELFV